MKPSLGKDPLAPKMQKLANSGHPRAVELLEKANAFEIAARGFFASPQTHDVKQFLGAYARARKLWCEITGEPLI